MGFPKIINSLVAASGDKSVVEGYQCGDFAVVLLKIVRIYFETQLQLFKEDWKLLLSKVAFPLMRVQKSEMELFDENAEEFIGIFEDCA
jgi:hypothetical protein